MRQLPFSVFFQLYAARLGPSIIILSQRLSSQETKQNVSPNQIPC